MTTNVDRLEEFLKKNFSTGMYIDQDSDISLWVDAMRKELTTLIAEVEVQARQEGRGEVVEYLKVHGEEAVKGLWYISDTNFTNALTTEGK